MTLPVLHLMEQLDVLLAIGYPDDPEARQQMALAWLKQECRNTGAQSFEEVSAVQWEAIAARCRYYAAQEFLSMQCALQRSLSANRREDLLLYLQDQLMRHNFSRLQQYDADKGASLKTWLGHVVANLIRDFFRKINHQKTVVVSEVSGDSGEWPEFEDEVVGEGSAPEQQAEADGLEDILSLLFSTDEAETNHSGLSLRVKLAKELSLTAEEQLFLKLIYVSDLNPEDAGLKLGLSKHAAYGKHRRLLEKVAEACKAAGVYQELQSLISYGEPRLEVEANKQKFLLEPKHIRHIQKDGLHQSRVTCLLPADATLTTTQAHKSFGDIHRYFYAYASLIQDKESVVDEHVEELKERPAAVVVSDLPEPLAVNSRYVRVIKRVLRQKY